MQAELARYGTYAAEAVQGYLPDGEPRAALWDLVADYPSRGGKAIRPSLCLATCVAFGGELEDALPSAAAIEILHHAFLVHDDVEDASELRRGAPTLHELVGMPLAVNAGDALALLATRPLWDNQEQLGSRLRRSGGRGVRPDGAAHGRGAGDRAGLAPRRTSGAHAGRLPRPDHAEDVLVHDDPPVRVGALIGSWGRADLDPLRPVRLLPGRGVPDPG